MRATWMTAALVVGMAGLPLRQQVAPLPAAEAAGLVGRTGFFDGPVAGIRVAPSGAITLDLDRRFPRASLAIVVPAGLVRDIPGLRTWTGRRVTIRGLVQRIDGRIQITLERAADLAIAMQPDRIPCD